MSGTARLIGNLVALVVIILGGAVIVDFVASWFGAPPFAFCAVYLSVFLGIGSTVAVGLGTVGFVVWTLQGFRGGNGAGLFFGALMVGIIPMLLPHYFGAAICGVA